MLTIRDDLAWVALNAAWQPDGKLLCKEHGVSIIMEVRRRSIYCYPMDAGMGDVPAVRHLYCPECHPERHRRNEEEGEPIYDIQLVDTNENLRIRGDVIEILTSKARAPLA